MKFFSTKTYEHSVGLSCAFRQWRAESHCRLLHGYALQISLEFSATELDGNNWVQDFGGLKAVKEGLVQLYDHRTVVAHDDPHLETFRELHRQGLINLRLADATGCEAFAREVAGIIGPVIHRESDGRVWLSRVEVREHGGNSAGVRLPS